MKRVKFNRSCAPYATGEIAMFEDEKARLMVDKGQANYVVEEPAPKKLKRRSLGENRQIDTE